jgi:hypothetical protein
MRILSIIGVALLASFLCVGIASADALIIQSQPGLTAVLGTGGIYATSGGSFADGQSVSTVAITMYPDWQPDNLDSTKPPQWISYAQTGWTPDSNFQPQGAGTPAGTVPIFSITHQIGLGYTNLYLHVWADDTAKVTLLTASGAVKEVFPANFAQTTCSGDPIGCLPEDLGNISWSMDPTQTYSLRFDAYQVGNGTTNASNPFGILYDGIATPEPGSIILFGTMLLGTVGLIRRKRS